MVSWSQKSNIHGGDVMWKMPEVGQKLKISVRFWDAYCNRLKHRNVPDWFNECQKDGGWILSKILPPRTNMNFHVVLCFSNNSKRFQINKNTGSLWSFCNGPPIFELTNKVEDILHSCPICGSAGTPFVNKFYCTNSKCQNYECTELLYK